MHPNRCLRAIAQSQLTENISDIVPNRFQDLWNARTWKGRLDAVFGSPK
ncbi:hypothetical protein V2H45_11090 [Tumidithrix elongata RA019]|uniref:Uncharacterized protein n=1 Tax=Tumidithrix elongata BACA0141 TaxID=2716417 RepID=A0AAW9PRE3_9CYAN|nr:hypothetical protein [Tumidithrix elongata RA019]